MTEIRYLHRIEPTKFLYVSEQVVELGRKITQKVTNLFDPLKIKVVDSTIRI